MKMVAAELGSETNYRGTQEWRRRRMLLMLREIIFSDKVRSASTPRKQCPKAKLKNNELDSRSENEPPQIKLSPHAP